MCRVFFCKLDTGYQKLDKILLQFYIFGISVVGIYGEGEEEQREAFEQVVSDINRDANLLKKTLLKADIIHNVNQKNAFTLKEKCKIIFIRNRIADL